jgi:hypothetical protein
MVLIPGSGSLQLQLLKSLSHLQWKQVMFNNVAVTVSDTKLTNECFMLFSAPIRPFPKLPLREALLLLLLLLLLLRGGAPPASEPDDIRTSDASSFPSSFLSSGPERSILLVLVRNSPRAFDTAIFSRVSADCCSVACKSPRLKLLLLLLVILRVMLLLSAFSPAVGIELEWCMPVLRAAPRAAASLLDAAPAAAA